jgi:hypothetical protein
MKKGDQSKINKEKPDGLMIYKPEDQIFQKLRFCEYLEELYEVTEDENEPPVKKEGVPTPRAKGV